MTSKLTTIALVFIFLTCGCGGGAGGSGSATLRVLNASQDVNPVNVVVGGETVVSDDPYPMCLYEICQTLSGYVQV